MKNIKLGHALSFYFIWKFEFSIHIFRGPCFRLRLRPQDCRSEECRPPIVVKVSNEALSLKKNRVSSVLQNLSRRLDTNSSFYFSPEKSFGALNHLADETALQWFAISLLRCEIFGFFSPLILSKREKNILVLLS